MQTVRPRLASCGNKLLIRSFISLAVLFVNVTADWCITCITNEKLALSRSSVLQAFSEENIAYLRADWTHNDPRITELLNKFNRSGVPLYIIFPKDVSSEPLILPQILTTTIILDALDKLKANEVI